MNTRKDGNELLCYCFKYTKNDFVAVIKIGKEKELVKEIKKKMKVPGCFCETANPSGKCCLNDVNNFILQNRNKGEV